MNDKKDLRTIHGLSRHDAYNSWSGMMKRCTDKNNDSYPHYGGRGIKVCERWNDIATFIKDMGPRPSNKHSIDRVNNDGDYEPSNCRWATQSQQMRNRRLLSSNISGITGVSRSEGKWKSYIGINGEHIYLGSTDDFFEACCRRKSAENRYWSDL